MSPILLYLILSTKFQKKKKENSTNFQYIFYTAQNLIVFDHR